MERRPILIGAGVLVVLLAAFGMYSLFRAPFEVRSARVVSEIPGMVSGRELAFARLKLARPEEAKIVVVTLRWNRASNEIDSSEFALRFTAQGAERTGQVWAICLSDEPEPLCGTWMVAESGEDISIQGYHSDYAHLGFIVPTTVEQATLLFKGEAIGSVNVRH